MKRFLQSLVLALAAIAVMETRLAAASPFLTPPSGLPSVPSGGLNNIPNAGLSAPPAPRVDPEAVGLEYPEAFTEAPDADADGFERFRLLSANAHRRVTDLTLNAGGGQHRLHFTRIHNTRFVNAVQHLGVGGNWRHNYQWDLAGNGDNTLDVYYPTGAKRTFTPFSGSEWRAGAQASDRLFKTNDTYTLQTSKGWQFIFDRVDGNYVFKKFLDSGQTTYRISNDSSNRVTKVSDPADRYIEITFTNALIASVAASDGRSVSYTYSTYSPDESYDALTSVSYGDSITAQYEYWAAVPVHLATANDPRVPGKATRIRYEYYAGNAGVIHKEINPVSSQVLARLVIVNATNRAVEHANGGTNFYGYTGAYVNAKTNALGNVNTFGYDTNGFLAAITNALGNVKRYTNTVQGNLLAFAQPGGAVETWGRDDLDLVLSHTNALGAVTSYLRTGGLIDRVTYPDGTYETNTYLLIAWHSPPRSLAVLATNQMRNGGLVTFNYDDMVRLTNRVDALGNATSYAYDSYERVLAVTNALGKVTSFLYNVLGQTLIVTNADGTLVKTGYDSYGNRTKQTNELGKVWTYVWNELRQMTSSTDPLGRTTSYEYEVGGVCCGGSEPSANLTKITLPGGQQTKFEYDDTGQRTKTIFAYDSSAASTNTFAYDAAGNMTNRVDGRGKNWKTTFDSASRPVSAVDPLTNTTTWTYSALGQKLTEIRPDGGTNKWLYDSMGRVTNTTDTLNQQTTFTYTALGKLNTLIDARANTTGWGYDLLGRQTYKTYADGYGDYYAYDAVGNLTLHTNASAQVHSFTYDGRNRNTTNSWNTTNGATVIKAYDAAGRLTNLVSLGAQSGPAVTNSYSYNDANQLLSELTQLSTITNQLLVSYAYNTNSQRSTLTYPDTSTATYTYTERGQVKEINAEGQTPLASFTYDLNGNRLTKPLANGTTANYTYDDASRLTVLQNVKGAAIIAQFDYNMDVVSRRTNRVELLTGGGTVTDTYKYDGTDQVTNVLYAGATTVTYGYDPLGNLTNKNHGGNSTNYQANNLNQYTNIAGSTLTYDSRGNMLARAGWAYTWDAQNRLLSAESATNKMTFAYDGRNRCVNRNAYVWTNSSWNLTTASCLTYDEWSLIDERNGSGTLVARYVNGPTIDELLRRTTGTATNYYHGDALNSTVALTDASGNAQERYRYDVFGMPAFFDASMNSLAISAFGNRTLFQGREWLTEVQLNDHRNRHYSAELQRWISRDPMSEVDGFNLYSMVRNEPTGWVDPMGLQLQGLLKKIARGLVKGGPGGLPVIPETPWVLYFEQLEVDEFLGECLWKLCHYERQSVHLSDEIGHRETCVMAIGCDQNCPARPFYVFDGRVFYY